MTQVDCSAYDYSCASSRMRGAYEAYPLHRPPSEISDTLSLDSDGGAAFRKRVLARLVAPAAPAAAPSRRWWLAATASDEGAVQVSKDPETTRRALEASRLTSLDDRLQAAVSSEGAVPGSTVLPAPLSKRLAWTMMDKKYAHDMLFDVAHMARHVAGFEKLVVVALDEPTTRACAAGSMANRYACLFRRLRQYTKPGSVVYIHVPSPETQLDDKGQYFENVVPPHLLIEGMAAYGFQLRHYGQDMRTLNGIKNRRGTYKYVDILFQRASTDEVFKAGR